MIVKLMDKYILRVPDNLGAIPDNKSRIGNPYWYFLEKKKKDLVNVFACMNEVIRKTNAESVIEYFGGIGTTTAIINEVLKPRKHTILDIDPVCIKILKDNYPDKNIVCTNSLEYKPDMVYDLSVLDYNKFTILHKFLDEPFKSDYIILTDSAIPKLHLNKKVYEDRFNIRVENAEDYANCYSKFIKERYNRYLTDFCYFNNACFLLFQKHPAPLEIKKFSLGPENLVLEVQKTKTLW